MYNIKTWSLDRNTEAVHGGQHGGVGGAGVGVAVRQSAVGWRDGEARWPASCQRHALQVGGMAVNGRGSQVVGVASSLGWSDDGGTGGR